MFPTARICCRIGRLLPGRSLLEVVERMDILPADPTYSFQWNTAADSQAGLRIAILGTPPTGNTWLRRMLGSVYSLPQIVEDDPRGISSGSDCPALQSRNIIGMRSPKLIAQLSAIGSTLLLFPPPRTY